MKGTFNTGGPGIFWLFLICCSTSSLLTAQTEWIEGAFDTRTGEKLSEQRWKDLLPDTYDLFGNDHVLELVIESDFRKFIKDKDKDQYQDALLNHPLNDTTVVKRIVRIKPRGVFRKKYCSVPPIKLNFKHTDLYVESVQQLEKMKVVTECRTYANYEDYVLREYLTYKLYQQLTDLSFKVKLLRLTTVDTGTKKQKSNSSYAFLIEELDDLAKRNNLDPLKVETAGSGSIVDENMATISMFQYMIGNTDWSVAGAHNLKLLKGHDPVQLKGFAAPYDFDYSGLVNAPYATPTPGLGISDVRTRYLKSPCYDAEMYKTVIQKFISKKDQMFDIIDSFSHLSDASKKDLHNFLQGFYKQIESQGSENFFLENCGNL
jgi:hypothetical protein